MGFQNISPVATALDQGQEAKADVVCEDAALLIYPSHHLPTPFLRILTFCQE